MKTSLKLRALALALLVACSSEESVGPDGNVDFEGVWTGNIGDPNLVSRVAVRWTATHTRSEVTGPFTFQLTPTLSVTGTMTGVISGDDIIDFTLNIPAGAYPQPVSGSCTLTGAGTSSSATTLAISALLALTYTAPCVGTVTTTTNVTHIVTLTKTG